MCEDYALIIRFDWFAWHIPTYVYTFNEKIKRLGLFSRLISSTMNFAKQFVFCLVHIMFLITIYGPYIGCPGMIGQYFVGLSKRRFWLKSCLTKNPIALLLWKQRLKIYYLLFSLVVLLDLRCIMSILWLSSK